MTEGAPRPTSVRRGLAALELAAMRHRAGVRRRLGVGDDELSALLHLDQQGAVTQSRLAELTTLSRSGAGAMVQRLEQRGLVQRRADPGDRRRRVVELSPAGRARVRRAYGELDAALDELLAARPAGELDAFAELLDSLARAATALGDETAPAASPSPEVPIWQRWG